MRGFFRIRCVGGPWHNRLISTTHDGPFEVPLPEPVSIDMDMSVTKTEFLTAVYKLKRKQTDRGAVFFEYDYEFLEDEEIEHDRFDNTERGKAKRPRKRRHNDRP